jgi:hypothetical protein
MTHSAIPRRRFLGIAGAAGVAGGLAQHDQTPPWWKACSTSARYRLVAESNEAEGLLIELSRDGVPFRLSFIDDEFPTSKPMALRRDLALRSVQVVGTVHYETGLIGARYAGNTSLILEFAESAAVSVYADESKEGGIVIVVTGERGLSRTM